MSRLGTLSTIVFIGSILADDESLESIDLVIPDMLPSSCQGLVDGKHEIQPLSLENYKKLKAESTNLLYGYDDNTLDAPVIEAKCNNGWTIIDPKNDPNFLSYFSSVHQYAKQYYNPDLNDHQNWQKWYLPTKYDADAQFTISEDCNTCQDAANTEYPGSTALYSTGRYSVHIYCTL